MHPCPGHVRQLVSAPQPDHKLPSGRTLAGHTSGLKEEVVNDCVMGCPSEDSKMKVSE